MIEPLTDDQIKAMLKACEGTDLRERRDEALQRLMVETGIRAGEAATLQLADVDLRAGTAIVRRGKGAKAARSRSGRRPPEPPTAYIRVRARTGWRIAPAMAGGPRQGVPLRRTAQVTKTVWDQGGVDGSNPRTGCDTQPSTAGSPPEGPRAADGCGRVDEA